MKLKKYYGVFELLSSQLELILISQQVNLSLDKTIFMIYSSPIDRDMGVFMGHLIVMGSKATLLTDITSI